MTNEIRFFYNLLKSEESLLDLITFYFVRLLKNHITNFIALDFEKSLLDNDFCNIKSNNILLISNDIDSMVKILNTKIKFDKPFNSLKYFRSFNNNQENILFITENIIDIYKGEVND